MNSASLRSRLILLAGTTVVVLALLVGVDHLFKRHYYSKTYKYYETAEVYKEDENTLLLFSPDRHLFWAIKPNIRLHIEEDPAEYDAYTIGTRPGHYSFEVRSNSMGLNSPEVELAKPAGTVRIVVLGDSRSMAEGVPFERLYSRRLEALLRESDPGTKYEVINGGVSGYSSHQGRVLFERKLLALQPDYVTVLFGINDQDLDQGVSDRKKSEIYDTWVMSLRGQVNRSMLIYFLRRQIDQLRGWLFGKTPVKSIAYSTDRTTRRVSPAEYQENLTAVAELGSSHGFETIFLVLPTSPYAYYASLFNKSTASLNSKDLRLQSEGAAAFRAGDHERAAELFARIVERNPQANPERRALAVALQHLGRFEEAHEQFVRLNEGIIFARYHEVVRWVATETKSRLVDLTPEFTELRSDPLYVDDMHPNIEGHDIIARRLLAELLR